ncbi:hypothetical protein WJX73_002712 [Symbiochloris irregularis]|uniref:Uncharacterized protein n=1 Tax=Symbiochloris irregularis TaxID=706552 RepID=A0AAW1P4B4_9CHLO
MDKKVVKPGDAYWFCFDTAWNTEYNCEVENQSTLKTTRFTLYGAPSNVPTSDLSSQASLTAKWPGNEAARQERFRQHQQGRQSLQPRAACLDQHPFFLLLWLAK